MDVADGMTAVRRLRQTRHQRQIEEPVGQADQDRLGVLVMGRLLADLGGDWVKLEKTAPLFLEFFHDRGDPKGVFNPQGVGDVGTDEM